MIQTIVTLPSERLQHEVDIHVLLPDVRTQATRVLWLLHGWYGKGCDWLMKTRLQVLAEPLDLVIVMPDAGNNYYSDVPGAAMQTVLIDDIMPAIQQLFGLSTTRFDNVIAGLSMGGYGAVKFALSYPQLFAKALSLSGALDIASEYHADWSRQKDFRRLFGSYTDFAGSNNDLMQLIKQPRAAKVPLTLYCGQADFLLPASQSFYAQAQKQGCQVSLTVDAGAHNWQYWDAHVPLVLRWALKREAEL